MTALVCHPLTPSAAVRGVDAEATRAGTGLLEVRYRIRAELARLRVPPPRPPAAADRLWQHTCCEIFVARSRGGEYHEYNFSPSGQWAAYAFRRYREGEAATAADPQIRLQTSTDGLELAARIAVPPGRLCVALCAVIEARDGSLSYWALAHAPGKPDFHHAAAFALELE